MHDLTPFLKAIRIFDSSITDAVFSQSEIFIPECFLADFRLGLESWSRVRGIECSISFSSLFLLV